MRPAYATVAVPERNGYRVACPLCRALFWVDMGHGSPPGHGTLALACPHGHDLVAEIAPEWGDHSRYPRWLQEWFAHV